MRFFIVCLGMMSMYGGYFMQIPPQVHQEIRFLSFVPSLKLYSKMEILEQVQLTKIDFLKTERDQEFEPVIDSVIQIPRAFTSVFSN